jgi:ech hydrogenase subunit E
MTTGGRVIFSVNKIGGVLKDISPEHLRLIDSTIDDIKQELEVIKSTFIEDATVQSRLRGIGILSKQQAHDLGCCGPVARASGIKCDLRKRGYEAYGYLDFEPIVSDAGDCFARCYVRLMEVFQSIDLIHQCIDKIPNETDISVDVKGNPTGESFVRIEQPRGEAVFYVKASGKPHLDRFRLRTPTFANLPGLCEMLKGAELSDVGLMVVTIDPCISCTER